MSNTVSHLLSCHGSRGSLDFGYRLILADGQMVVKTEAEVRCMVGGDLAIEQYDPFCPLEHECDEPLSTACGPRKGDILLLRIEQCRSACEVLQVRTNHKGRPLYTVKYDDGMLVEDHLSVPWSYLSTASQDLPTTDTTVSVTPDAGSSATAKTPIMTAAATAEAGSAAAPPPSAKSKRKRRAKDPRDLYDPICSIIAAAEPPPAFSEEDRKRKREIELEQEYGQMIDTIIL